MSPRTVQEDNDILISGSSRSAYSILANQDRFGAAANIGGNHIGADRSTSCRGADELPPLGRATADYAPVMLNAAKLGILVASLVTASTGLLMPRQ